MSTTKVEKKINLWDLAQIIGMGDEGDVFIYLSQCHALLCFWFFFTPFLLLFIREKVKVSQPCLTLSNPVNCSPSGSSVHGILQARILEWVSISFSRGFSHPRDWTHVSSIAGRFLTNWATREALLFAILYS